jgi:hypothetical protein
MVVIGYFFFTVLPLRAGELVRIGYFSRRAGVPALTVAAAAVVERAMDLIVLAKYVPDIDRVPDDAWDRERGTLIRARLEMAFNPLDRVALRMALAVKRIIGICFDFGSAFSFLQRISPCIFGKRRSRSIRSGPSLLALSRPSSPLAAVTTI